MSRLVEAVRVPTRRAKDGGYDTFDQGLSMDRLGKV